MRDSSGTGTRGAEFGEVQPTLPNALLRVGGKDPTVRIDLGNDQDTLENGLIVQVTPDGAFRPGQQVIFYLTVYNGSATQDPAAPWINFVRLKPWFKRPTLEKRGPGDAGNTAVVPPGFGWIGPDENTFGSGPIAAPAQSSVKAENNRLVWFPVPKMFDTNEWSTNTPPPAIAPPRHSDSIFLDDVWTMYLQDPNNPAYAATRGLTQPNYGRSASFMYVSHGYALGLTHQFTLNTTGTVPHLFIDISWVTGTL